MIVMGCGYLLVLAVGGVAEFLKYVRAIGARPFVPASGQP
jgi:hypothetical protein